MPIFIYEAKTASGQVLKKKLEAKDINAAKEYLAKQKLTVKSIHQEGMDTLMGKLQNMQIGSGPAPGLQDLVIFTRQFAIMIDAGLPLVQCLDILGNGAENKNFGKILMSIKESVEGGSSFADSLRKHPKMFDNLFCNLVQAGEIGGILDTIMNRLAVYMEKAAKLKRQIKGAMIYPISVLTITAIVVSVIMIFVIPTFKDLYAGFGQQLPLPTRVVMAISEFLVGFFYIPPAIIFVTFVAIKQWRKTADGRYKTDKFLLKLPIFGILVLKAAVAKFSRTMGTMLSSGVPLIDSLDICAKTAGNQVIENALLDVKKGVQEGRTVAEPLEQTKVFPYMVTQMMNVGEATGAMDAMLNKIADFYEEEVDQAVENIQALMEPLIILLLGVVIGGIITAMYLPIFNLVSVLGGGGG